MPVVQGKALKPDGNVDGQARIKIELVGADPDVGFVTASDHEIIGSVTLKPNLGTGVWSAALVANALITPINTVYKVTVSPGKGSQAIEYISVPNGAGPYWVFDILTTAPDSTNSVVATLVSHQTSDDTVVISSDVVGDAYDRLQVTAGGKIGSGNGTAAVTLSRPPKRRFPTYNNIFTGATRLSNNAYSYLLYDGGRVYIWDAGVLNIKQSDDLGVTLTNNKTMPIAFANIGGTPKLCRFGAHIYCAVLNSSNSRVEVYRAAPIAGNTAFSWSSVLLTETAGATTHNTVMNADATYLYLAEYGDPPAGPCAYRTADGVTWETIYGPDVALRHIHSIKPDPYHAGHVYMTCGDGVGNKTVQRSTNYGTTWTQLTSATWQAVQISFDPEFVWFAADSSRGTVFVIDRDDLTAMWASTNSHRNFAHPDVTASLVYGGNCYLGAVEPSSGVYYCVSNESASGRAMGLFYMTQAGGRLEILDAGANNISLNGEVIFGGGYVFSGGWRHPLVTITDF